MVAASSRTGRIATGPAATIGPAAARWSTAATARIGGEPPPVSHQPTPIPNAAQARPVHHGSR